MIYKVKIGIFQTLMQYLWYNLWYFKLWCNSYNTTDILNCDAIFMIQTDISNCDTIFMIQTVMQYKATIVIFQSVMHSKIVIFQTVMQYYWYKLWCNIDDANCDISLSCNIAWNCDISKCYAMW